jgi:hypothetical protein
MVVFQSSIVVGQWIKTNPATPRLLPFALCLLPLPFSSCPLPSAFCLPTHPAPPSPMSAGGHKADIFMSGRTFNPCYQPRKRESRVRRTPTGHRPNHRPDKQLDQNRRAKRPKSPVPRTSCAPNRRIHTRCPVTCSAIGLGDLQLHRRACVEGKERPTHPTIMYK